MTNTIRRIDISNLVDIKVSAIVDYFDLNRKAQEGIDLNILEKEYKVQRQTLRCNEVLRYRKNIFKNKITGI